MSMKATKPGRQPVVFWHSDPVMPDETAVLAGADFSARSVVELAQVSDGAKEKWTAVAPTQWSEVSLKAVIPAKWPKGVYACRVRDGRNFSKTVYLNAPDVWWKQGEGGVDAALSGGWLRLFGKCLDIDGRARVRIVGGPDIEMEERGCFALRAKLPTGLSAGEYPVEVSNGQGGAAGWRSAGLLKVKTPVPDTRPVLNVLDYGADPTGMKDCTLAIVQAFERAHGLDGGIVYLPRGRYRVDGILRSGTWIDSPLILPENVSLRGDGASLTSLWWPTREKALPTLIECRRGCSVENLAIYTQGPMNIAITGDSDVTLRNLTIRVNAYYMTTGPGRTHHGNPTPTNPGGPAISLWGDNNRLIDCDIVSSANCVLDIRRGRGTVISGNALRGGGTHALNFCSEMIYENNRFEGSHLSGGGNIALHFGGVISRHVYYAGNCTRHLYTGDHECLTFDGHGGAYFGRVKDVAGTRFTLAGRRQGREGKGTMADMHGTAVYIGDGRGVGQYRFLTAYDDEGHVTVDRPWDVDPNASSLIEIGGFNGRHLIIGNTGEDVGTLVQLYPTNCECFVVGNKGIRASNINSLSSSGTYPDVKDPNRITRMEVSWRNQFLDNEIVFGNAWGGGLTEVDRWLGGEATLQIHGCARRYAKGPDGVRHTYYQDAEWVAKALGEKKLRDINIAPSRFQIVRRHIVRNNSSIRVRGCVADALVEHCRIACSRRGVRIDAEVQIDIPNDLGMLCDFFPEPSAAHPVLSFLRPTGVLVRRNRFDDVQFPYSGSALEQAKVED